MPVELKKDITESAGQVYMNLKKFTIIFALLAVIVFRYFVMERVIVYGESMYPTCHQGEVYMSKKINIEPARYDIVIAKRGYQMVIKRVIGLPGDNLIVSKGKVYINGCAVDEKFDYITEDAGLLENYYFLEENCYFLMGDNRSNSVDSREYGSVGREDIKGIVVFKIFPFW